MSLPLKALEELCAGPEPATAISRHGNLMDELAKRRADLCQLRKRHALELADREAQIARLQNEACQHPGIEYQGDPAGGSDRCWTCPVCGRQETFDFR